MTRYRIRHRTEYRYDEPVSICHNEVRMRPRDDLGMRVERSELVVEPAPDYHATHIDYFGNHVDDFAVQGAHDRLTVTVDSVVDRRSVPATGVDTPWETHRRGGRDGRRTIGEYRSSSPRVQWNDAMRDYAATSFAGGRPIGDAVIDLTRRINADFRYDPTATDVTTPILEAFASRAGVCQDFAHLQIGMLRSMGLAARYVSGYLRTLPPPGRPRLVGADASHAWCAVAAIDPTGDDVHWIDVDPTNAAFCGDDHLPIAVGRDYDDVAPLRGVVVGGGRNRLKVGVDVEPID